MHTIGTILLAIAAGVAILPTLEATCSFEVEGFLAIVYTPVDDDGNLNLDVIPQYAQYLKDNGVDGVVVAASSGEGPSLSVSENKELLDAWMEVAPSLDMYVVSSVGAIQLPDAEEIAAYSEEKKVDAILALPENYYKPRNADELVYYLEFISKAAPDTPLLYYHLPHYTNVFVDMERFLELATERLPNFRGMKSNVLETSLELRTKVTGEQTIFISDYEYLAPGLFMGFDNFMMTALNLFPTLIFESVRAYQRGNETLSIERYQRVVDLMDAILEEGNNEHAPLKAAMPLVTGIDVGPPRPPLMPLTEEEEARLEQKLRAENIRIINSANDK